MIYVRCHFFEAFKFVYVDVTHRGYIMNALLFYYILCKSKVIFDLCHAKTPYLEALVK